MTTSIRPITLDDAQTIAGSITYVICSGDERVDVAKNNPNAERLYDRLGFLRVGENDKDCRMRHAAAAQR